MLVQAWWGSGTGSKLSLDLEAGRLMKKSQSANSMWYDSMQKAIHQTVIISEILDSRTRHLISVGPKIVVLQAALQVSKAVAS